MLLYINGCFELASKLQQSDSEEERNINVDISLPEILPKINPGPSVLLKKKFQKGLISCQKLAMVDPQIVHAVIY
ncbi:unnamed protein product [Acanthoscelides obtectus]|uniref:Uncharacterized protein n=1 Tax=Acanthoscelides obtectus TaxID=200917 RepID=A0A9P0NYN8_ACAOB|nr:unnamed protein product [Acanthoscelides obtectus]CAK1661920.1 hypothetical protein AOBTE_LOCUS22879 [Acanthoscelides obtectus]